MFNKSLLNQTYSFTPPTCSLEIRNKRSLSSLWFKPNRFDQLSFKLSFDDPRVPHSQQVTISGDRADLERLQLAVNDYVQNLLANSVTIPTISVTENWRSPQSRSANHAQLYLQPQGLVNHELYLASLNHNSQQQQLTLSTVQLFDLANALDSYRNYIAKLAVPNPTPQNKLIFRTGAIAAMALAAVGITVLWLRSRPVSELASTPQAESPAEIGQLDEIVPPTKPATKDATPQPQVSESIASRQKLPPPPAVDAPKPQPNIPNPADYPLAEVGRQSGFKPSPQQPKTQSKSKTGDRLSSESETSITVSPSVTNNPNNNVNDNFQPPSPLNSTNNPSNVALNNKHTNPSQLQQIDAYFQEQWQPPADLQQSLEYRIYLNQDGSIERVVPLGKASRLYLSQTKIPVRGEKFIAPLQESDSPTIRLLLNPDGGVQTFKE